MTSELLGLIQLGAGLDLPLDALRSPISARFPNLDVGVANPLGDPTEAYDSRRDQYHSTRILALLEGYIRATDFDRLLGVASFDMYVPEMNFVFGEARMPGRVGVISTHRLLPKETDQTGLLQDRVVKEAVHEIGHMMGLRHCNRASCVMHFSESLIDTDIKSSDLCHDCKLQLKASA